MRPESEGASAANGESTERHVDPSGLQMTGSQASVAASALHLSHKQQLGLGGLVCLIFLEVCGGPFGTEEAVQAAGPRLAIIGFAVLPFIWSIPEALVCAELATAFPENSGYVVWVETAFGPFFGFLEGLFSWISGVTDNTIYPIMFLSYLQLFFPALSGGWIEKVTLLTTSFAMILLNYRGLDIVGKSAEVVTLVTLVPFVVLAAMSIPHLNVSNWAESKPLAEVDWINYFNIMFWSLNSWDSVSTLAGEVRDPSRMLPKALFLAVQLVIVTYLVPLMVSTAVTDVVDGSWKLGYYGHIAELVGGKWLALAVTVSAAVSQVGMFEAEMSSDSYQVLGMAERGYLPRSFAKRSRYGTPIVGIALSSLGIVTMVLFNFNQIVQMLNAVYCLAELLEFAAFIRLRMTRPDLQRGYIVPLPTWGLIVMLLPASALLLTVLVLPVLQMQWGVVLYTLGVAMLGFFLYALLQLLRRRRTVVFEYNERLSRERWPSSVLGACLSLFPSFLVAVAMNLCYGAAIGLCAAVALSVCCVLTCALWGLVGHLMNNERSLDIMNRYSSHLMSIPEAGMEAPLMRAFLRDSIVHSNTSAWALSYVDNDAR